MSKLWKTLLFLIVAAAASAGFKLHAWLLGTADAGNLAVTATSPAVLGGSGTVSLTPSGLVSGKKYLGSVVYGGSASLRQAATNAASWPLAAIWFWWVSNPPRLAK